MNTFVFVLAAASAVALVHGATVKPAGNPVREKVVALSKKCAADSKATPDQAKIAFSQDLPKTETERCYLECLYTGVGAVKDGGFNVEGAKKLASNRFTNSNELGLANKLIESCAKEVAKKEGEKCSLGHSIRECFVKHGKEVNFFPSS
uniref:Venom POBP 3 n=1 Tax=Lethocerus distinctifemur TaxID=280095 RepID=A0A2K8JL82_9HEMI|nr:venom POBP 3 [Lethocerus distinctifemur]